MPEYELYYFDFPLRGEVARWLFVYGGIPFKDHRVSVEEWPKLKGNKKLFPYGVMPVLHVGNDRVAESHVINRFIARLAKLDHAEDPLDHARLDEVYELVRAFYDDAFKYVITVFGFIPGDKNKAFEEILVPAFEKHVPNIERNIKGNGWFSERGISHVDLFYGQLLDMLNIVAQDFLKSEPESYKFWQRVTAEPRIKEFVAKRKQ
ncbi:unnamed protein product [Bursaphelenchus xylophilus]|uniref:glutathione transferase n=1 Tax=Bursaphelenchus xylophilus TaxID=6326 RepID=A0A1I7RQI9_BURXY|nr:unnamed protein product [Bursaphelenchus xylophilus]CAG9104658.1 unnamed protein product [Bursaphelenchus xylophilus]